MTANTTLNIKDMFGHMAKVEFKPKNHYQTTTMEGKIIYSFYQASLFFKPKGSRNHGYIIENESDIKSFEIIRKNNKENLTQIEAYKEHDLAVQRQAERFEREERERQERNKQIELKRQQREQEEQEEKEREMNEARSVCNYDELESEIMAFYENSGEPYSKGTVKNIMLPMFAKIVYKGITDISVYPKHFFDKKNNPRFCKLLEEKTGVKLTNTQKKNLDILNQYLAS